MTTSELKALAVDAFPLSKRRANLWLNFEELLADIKAQGLSCDAWIDGSFLTKKIEPDDIDFVLDFPLSVVDNANPAQRAFLSTVANNGFKSKKLHSFMMYSAPVVHLAHAESVKLHDYWRRTFGLSRSRMPKGIAVLEIAP